jgi:hypothetical protein
MVNDGDCSLGSPCQSIAQRKISKEATVRPASPLPIALNSNKSCTNAAAETQGDVTFNSRAYQLEMLEESLKRNVIVAVYFLLLLFVAPLS